MCVISLITYSATARKLSKSHLLSVLPFSRILFGQKCSEDSRKLSKRRSSTTTMAEKAVQKQLESAASAIHGAKALIFTSGAGMGVDSGLPDFRGPEGFWKAYPPLRDRKLELQSMSNPRWFDKEPRFAWGFFGHRYNLYSQAKPHDGFRIILDWCRKMERGYFAFTSNVDGHLQKAGFEEDRIVECHGSIHYLQCVQKSDSGDIWPVPPGTTFDVDDQLHLTNELPVGPPGKDYPARPNIMMFGDWGFLSDRTSAQHVRFDQFQCDSLENGVPFVVIEIGAGLAVPTVRCESESLVSRYDKGTLIRINPSEPEVPRGHIGLNMTGLKALQQLKQIYNKL